MENKNELLDLVIKAHGGLERWKQFKQMKLHILLDNSSYVPEPLLVSLKTFSVKYE